MPVYYEVINGTIYVVNRHNPLVKTPANIQLSVAALNKHQVQEICDAMNAVYRAGYQTALNQFRAYLDQAEVKHEKSTH